MNRRLIFMLFLLNNLLINAQNFINVEDVFTMQIFLDKKNIMHSSTIDLTKNDFLYQSFKESLTLKIDTVNKVNKLNDLNDPFRYYKIDLKSLNQKLPKNESTVQSLSLFHGLNTILIIAINHENGLIYRLKGFNGNDFPSYFHDFKAIYLKQTGDLFSNKKFIKEYVVEGLDFECLLKCFKDDCPCLNKYSDPIRIE